MKSVLPCSLLAGGEVARFPLFRAASLIPSGRIRRAGLDMGCPPSVPVQLRFHTRKLTVHDGAGLIGRFRAWLDQRRVRRAASILSAYARASERQRIKDKCLQIRAEKRMDVPAVWL
jgi:hypothetical protein